MAGLHTFFINFTISPYTFFLFNNSLIFLISFYYFLVLLISLIFYSHFNKTQISWIKTVLKQFFFFNLLFSICFFFYKFFSFFWISNYFVFLPNLSTSNFYQTPQLLNHNPLGDVLVLLCLITVFISWVYLSERYLFLNVFNVFYFFIFVVFTVNMVYTSNLLLMFIFFEFIFLPSLYFVYWLSYSEKSDKTIKYLLFWTLSGSFFVACGLVYTYSITATLTLENLYFFQFSVFEEHLLFFCFFLGFGVKLPLWPFHYWLTKVHVEAPTGFSIFLSGYLVKTALFCLIYFSFLFKHSSFIHFILGLIFFGAIDASIRMWTSTDIKRLIAFATIQEMNLIVGFFFLLDNTYFQFLNIFLLVHGVLSTLLFFLIDQIQKRFQTRNIVTMGGLANVAPTLHTIIWLSILIFRGFPIFIKFFIEWELLSLLLQNFFIWGFVLFLLISVYGVLGFCRIWFSVLYGQPSFSLKNQNDILQKDFYIAVYLLSLLAVLSVLIFFF